MKFKTPSRIQIEAIECGAVSYWIINGYYNNWLSTETCRNDVNITKDGSNAYNIVQALKRRGFESDGYEASVDELKSNQPTCGLPCITWINKDHWVVVERFDGHQFLISDPAKGYRKATPEEFTKEYSGLAISAKPGKDFRPSGKKPNNIIEIAELVKDQSYALLLYCAIATVLTIPIIALSSYVGYFTDTILSEVDASNSYIWLLALIVGIYFTGKYIEQLILRRFQLSTLSRLLEKTTKKLLDMPVTFYALRDLGEVSQRNTLNISLANTLSGPLASSVVGVITMVIYGMIMLSYNLILGVVVIAIGVGNSYLLYRLAESLRVLSQKSSLMKGKMTSNILTMANDFHSVKANGLELSLFQRWSDNFSQYQSVSEKISYVQKRNACTTTFTNQLADYLIVILSGLFIMMGKLTLGEFISFRLIALAFLKPVGTLSGTNQQFENAVGDVNRLNDLWGEQEYYGVGEYDATDDNSSGIIELKQPGKLKLDLSPTLKANDLGYRYTSSADPVIDGMSFKLNSGDVVSLSGNPGIGKTTLLNLLIGLLKPTSGNVHVCGKEIGEIPPDVLGYTMSFVTSNSYLFAAGLVENVGVFDPQVSQREVTATLNLYGFNDLAKSLPNGLSSSLGPSIPVSNTDRIIIGLSRALSKNPRIVLIDSGLESLGEYGLEALIRITRFVPIVIFVSNSPEYIELANRSFVLKSEGQLVETNPQELSTEIRKKQANQAIERN